MSEKLAEFFWNHRWKFTIILVILTAVLAPFAAKVKPDNSIEAVSMEGDPNLALLRRVEQVYGSEEFISIAFEAKDIFSAKALQVVQRISEFAQTVDGVDQVWSLTTINRIQNSQQGDEETLSIDPFIDKDWVENGVPEDQRAALLSHPLYRNLIYNPEGTVTAIMTQLVPLGSDEGKRSEIVEDFDRLLQSISQETGIKFSLYGYPVFTRALFHTVEKEQNFIAPLMLLGISIILFFLYRHYYLSLAPVVLLGLCFVMAIGVLGVFGINLNWVTSTVPIVIIIVCVCDAVHVINEFKTLPVQAQGKEKVKLIFKHIGPPCLLTSATTIVGFLSLTTVPVRPLKEFGLYVSLGVFVAFLLSFTLLVLFLNYGPQSIKKPTLHQKKIIQPVLDFCFNLVTHRPGLILGVSLILIPLSIWGIFQIIPNQTTFDYFKKDPYGLFEANQFLEKGAGGGAENYVLFKSDTPGFFYEPENLKVFESVDKEIEEVIPKVLKTISLADLVKYANQSFHKGDPQFYRIPDTKEEVANLVLFLQMNEDSQILNSVANQDFSQARGRVFTALANSSQEVMTSFETAGEIVKKYADGKMDYEFTGRPLINARMIQYLPQVMVKSIIMTIAIITILLMILFRSVFTGFISIIPNAIPIVVGMGFMGWIGIHLNPMTSIVFAISIGIAVDDTIHLIWNMKKQVESGLDYHQAFKKSLDEVGMPIVISTFVLMAGFLMLSFSSLWPTTYLGLLIALCCFLALIADLILTPVVLFYFKPFSRKK